MDFPIEISIKCLGIINLDFIAKINRLYLRLQRLITTVIKA